MKDLLSAWPFWAVLSAAFAALTAVLAKMGVSDLDPNFATLVRTLVVVAIAALIVAVTGSKPASLVSIPARSWIFLVLSGAATGLSWLCYFRAIKLGDVARVAPIDKLSVVLVAVFAALFLGERLSAANWAGVVLMALGAILVAARI